uniref:hypothetical protein n=1 Tax=Fodinicola feengrottensis TaxID=435914 RepID=UPI0013D3A76F
MWRVVVTALMADASVVVPTTRVALDGSAKPVENAVIDCGVGDTAGIATSAWLAVGAANTPRATISAVVKAPRLRREDSRFI